MRWLIWLLLILCLATGIALVAGDNHGYVLMVRPPYRLELSLNLLVALIVLAFVVLHLILRLIHYTRKLPASIRTQKEIQRLKSGHAALIESLHAIVEGHFSEAATAAARALKLGENSGLSALIAARAAHKLKRKDKRDQYLEEADRLAPGNAVARLLTQAEMLLDDRDYQQANLVLEKLYVIEPNHPQALQLSLKVEMRLEHWEQVLTIMQKLDELNLLEPRRKQDYRQFAHQHLIQQRAGDLPSLIGYWQSLSDEDRTYGGLTRIAAVAFLQSENSHQAAEILRASLEKTWDSELVKLWGACASADPKQQLMQGEQWLTQHPNDAMLLLSLAHCCGRLQRWDAAENYLNASINVKASAAAHFALAKLLDSAARWDNAIDHYRRGVELLEFEYSNRQMKSQ